MAEVATIEGDDVKVLFILSIIYFYSDLDGECN